MLFHLIVVWFHPKKEGDCSGRLRERRIWLAYVRLLSLPFLKKNVVWSTPTNFTLIFFLKNLTIPRLSINLRLLLVSRTLKRRKVIKWGFRYHKFPPRFCVYKWASSLFPGIVFKFHMAERWTVRIAILTLTSPFIGSWNKRLFCFTHYTFE